jgi:hypothetical protein
MADAEFTSGPDGSANIYELSFCMLAVIFSAGVVVWMVYVLPFPHIHGNANNLIGVLILLLTFLWLFALYGARTLLLVFEIRGGTLLGRTLELRYRYLGKRRVSLPYNGRAKRNVKLFDFRAENGYRLAHVVFRSPWDRAVIPLEISGSEDLVELLTQSNVAL